jgi:transposase-like protein
MAERRTRRRAMPAFKAQAIKRVLDGGSLSEVATELGLSTGQLSPSFRIRGFCGEPLIVDQ